jgi:hypothetical protein
MTAIFIGLFGIVLLMLFSEFFFADGGGILRKKGFPLTREKGKRK